MIFDVAPAVEVLARAAISRMNGHAFDQNPWLIYGCGSAGRGWAQALIDAGAEVRAFVDRRAADEQFLQVVRPEDCPEAWKKECSLLLGLHNPGVDIGALRHEMQAIGFTRVWLLQELIDQFPQRAHFWLAPSRESLDVSDDILKAYATLADEKSRDLFVALLDQRLNAVTEGLPRPDPENAYLPPDLRRPSGALRFIDCGAYVGDTIENFRRLGYEFAEIAAFEPDPAHYPKLAKALRTERASLFPCGVWNCTQQLRFVSNDAASHVASNGDTMIQVVALDDALPGFSPTFIKMDIEGAEDVALLGAREMITAHRPRLAISAYHQPRDLWDLLIRLQSWDLGYSFYLRDHSFNGFDTVLYALPDA